MDARRQDRGPGRRATRLVAATLAFGLAWPAAAAPGPEELTPRIEGLFESANRASAAGDHVRAAEQLAEAFDLLPERREHGDSRALALLDSVRARRRAFAALNDPLQLCAARDLIARYLKEAAEAYGIAAATMDGPSAAGRERQEIDTALDQAEATCASDHPNVDAGPAPEPGPEPGPPPTAVPSPRRAPLRVAGVVSLGVGGGMLAMMAVGLAVGARAEVAGRELRQEQPMREIEALLDDAFYRRGVAANRVALAGGILGGLAVVVGASLLIADVRSPTRGVASVGFGPSSWALRLHF